MLTTRRIIGSCSSRLLLGMVVALVVCSLPASAEAACGDYLQHHPDEQITPVSPHHMPSPLIPPGHTTCRNGQCQPLPIVPTPIGSGVDARWFEVRSAWTSVLNSLTAGTFLSTWGRQVDEVCASLSEAPPGPVPRS